MNYDELLHKFISNPFSMNKSSGQLGKRYNLPKEEVQRAKDQARYQLKSNLDYLKNEGTNFHQLHLSEINQRVVTTAGTFNGNVTSNIAQKDKIESFKEDVEKGTAEISGKFSAEIKTLEELIDRCKIDTEKWEITNYVQNFWGNDNYPCWQVKAFMKLKVPNPAEIIKNVFENYKSTYKPLSKDQILKNTKFQRKSLVLISIADFHLDKRTLDGKTLEQKVKLYEDVVSNLLLRSYMSHSIQEICYLISNDFLHTDNYQESTTRLTPQQSSTSWHNAYEVGFDLQVRVINQLRQFCQKLRVVHVPSNHSRTKEYYMAHGLAMYFKPDQNIVFDRTAEPTKCVTYGNNFIGFHHGDVKDYNQLPTYFASKYKKEWGQSKYVEIALADKHHRKEWKHSLTKNEVHGSRMFIAPSLSGPDIWHKDSLYDLAIQASIARIYDFERGYVGEIEERI